MLRVIMTCFLGKIHFSRCQKNFVVFIRKVVERKLNTLESFYITNVSQDRRFAKAIEKNELFVAGGTFGHLKDKFIPLDI